MRQTAVDDTGRRQQVDALERWRSILLIIILGSLSAFGPLSLDMYLPALPLLSQDLGANASEAQLTLSACLVGLALGQLLAGPLSDSLGRRRPLLIGLLIYILASLCCAVVPSITLLIGLRLIQGMAGAAGIVIARATVRDKYSGILMARFFSMLMLVSGIAPIAAPLIGGFLLRLTTWRGIFLFLTLLVVLIWIAALLGLPESLPPERRQSGKLGTTLGTFRRLLTDKAFLSYALSCGLSAAAMFAYISGSPFVTQDIYGLSPQAFSLVFGTNALGIAIMGQINGRLVGRIAPRKLLAGALTAVALGSGGLFLAVIGGVGLIGILPALFVVVASQGMVFPNAATLALTDHPREAGSAAALVGLLQFVLGAIASPLVGIAGSQTAVPMASIIGVLGLSALLTFWLLGRRQPFQAASSLGTEIERLEGH
ncbi:Bcr/CflA family multidrug efflux MFS transporter [Thermogemmatispora sp.]|uniref:Bcr/CflA family multidrug efflux MFS transporter n=1 Tax=Thermogemmatispora sp. TaxID=1968838 RepID=UPI001D6C1B0A|nr:Bcr/CflA family multidrug efflux MFS transporter [Thermogemmatispora sp.]MBX5450902.1 Bcr/CflA family multidrug efflux MFS transporter [Thermogemmatispora sp.]